MAGKKSAKSNNNDDKEECGSTKGYEDLYAMIQGLTLNMNTFIADLRKEREHETNKEDLNRATVGYEVGIKTDVDLATEAQEQVSNADKEKVTLSSPGSHAASPAIKFRKERERIRQTRRI